MYAVQKQLFPDQKTDTAKKHRSGTFVDNMKLPVHRWFRYSAGFSAEWVNALIIEIKEDKSDLLVFDPFAGSGTTLLAADYVDVKSIGIEAHPFVSKITHAKLSWSESLQNFSTKRDVILNDANEMTPESLNYPDLIHKCFNKDTLTKLDRLKRAWIKNNDESPSSSLSWLALTAVLRSTSSAGTAQWQYILPNKKKKVTSEPFEAFRNQIGLMIADMRLFQKFSKKNLGRLFQGDARKCPDVPDNCADLVITSPPYANNYDYADATRFEMSFWGEIQNWGDLHQAVRQYLIRSSSQHASKEKLILEEILQKNILKPIYNEISEVCHELAKERLLHGGKKHYHTMIAAYFYDMAKIWYEIKRICKNDAKLCFVIGDSAPYGVYVPVEKWLGKLAIAAGFKSYYFEKLRDRNIKWKNRKHRVPLHEGRLWIDT
ncbi:DNA methyltransferase [Desulfococcaceae bacterium HSG8]|nr:DNA methyltransferase [Desulfococcaceae bacterium HSG8]